MDDLISKKCLPCCNGSLPLSFEAMGQYRKKVSGWKINLNAGEIPTLEKKYKFKNFLESQNFVNQVGKLAEEEGHHPDISFGWGYVNLLLTTHVLRGLSQNDFILAAKIDALNFKDYFR